jgi:two-component system, OmpR family, copper resistance phosphate regulon response regulator CusR
MAAEKNINVLYLEDDQDSIELVKFTLGLDGINVRPVSTFEDALEMAQSGRFDLYLLDGLLQSGYSFDLCRQLRDLDPNVPIVFYSALGFPSDIKEGVSAGADVYLIKPFAGDLSATVRETIAEKKGLAAATAAANRFSHTNTTANIR